MSSYDHIKVLSEFNQIRKRPGMWIGETSTPIHLLWEVLDNALDEAAEGQCDYIGVIIDTIGKYFCVEDHGRGFPLYATLPDGKKEDAIESAFTKLFSGGKFDHDSYSHSIGTHGVGLAVVNALSKEIYVSSSRNGTKRVRKFIHGELTDSFQSKSSHNGTSVTVYPNPEYFDSIEIDPELVRTRLGLSKSFLSDIKICLTVDGKTEEISPLTEQDLLKSRYDTPPITVESTVEGESIKIIFAYDLSKTDTVSSGAVNLLAVDKGSHITFALKCIGDAWHKYSNNASFKREDSFIGVRVFVDVRLKDPKYTSQAKTQLSMSRTYMMKFKDDIVPKILDSLKANKSVSDALLKKFNDYRSRINQLNSSKYLDSVLVYGNIDSSGKVVRGKSDKSSKLLDCTSKSTKGTELFVVEGDSAGGSLIPRRDRKIHAILPLRGKTLNVINKPIQRILNNLEIRSLINAIGAGANIRQDASKCRYEKIIIASDADADGLNIQALLIGCLCSLVYDVIKHGYVYVAQAPTYGYYKSGKFIPWYDRSPPDVPKYTRFKGLGDMSSEEIEATLLNPDTRKLIQLTITDDEKDEIIEIIGSPRPKREILVLAGVIDDQ